MALWCLWTTLLPFSKILDRIWVCFHSYLLKFLFHVKITGLTLDANMSAIIMIVIQVVAATISTSLIDNIGRRILFIVSSIGTAIGLALMGTYSYLVFQEFNLDGFDWVPVTTISFSLFMAYIGLVPLVFVVIIELLPVKVRTIHLSHLWTNYILLF